jgi:hypothetical protein
MWCFSNGKGSPMRTALVDKQIARGDETHIGRNVIADRELYYVGQLKV